jgi:nitrate/nitrite transport system ATP-binding protein
LKTALEIWRLGKSYPTPTGPAEIVKDFNLTVAEGEFIAVIGHSGCGKSTVLSMIAGLNSITSGGIILDGREIDGPGPDRGVVFQSPSLLPWLTAQGNVQLAVDQVFGHRPKRERQEITAKYLRLVGLEDSMQKLPAELSQGMRQRVGIARAFAIQPKLLLLDEPFGMLDSLTRFELQELLTDVWRSDKKTALIITHDVDEALYLADRIVMMTNAPAATVGEILNVPFERPRHRTRIMESAEYDACRERILAFLEGEPDHELPAAPAETPESVEAPLEGATPSQVLTSA